MMGHGKMYTVWEAGHHTISTHRMQGETGDLGMDPHTDTLDTRVRTKKYTQGMAPSPISNSGHDKNNR
jgi:hypothetical protein